MSGERTRLSQRVLTMDDRETVPPWFIRHVTLIARIWGVLTVTVIWISAIFTLQRHYHKEKVSDEKLFVAWYFVGIGVVMVFLELVWVINKSACCRADGCCCAIWRIILWVDDWKRGVLYILFSIPAFLEGIGVYFSLISGFMLIVLGCLYITKTFRHGGYTMIREIRNTQYVESGVPKPKVITMEVTTQTDDDQYYGKLVERSDKPSAPPEQEPTR